MADRSRIPVTGRDGVLGWMDPVEQPAGDQDALVHLENGQTMRLPKDLLISQPEGGYYLPMSRDQFEPLQHAAAGSQETVLVIPVLAEELEVSRRQTTTGRVRISKSVHEKEQVIDAPIFKEEVDVQRVPVNRVVDAPPDVRYEGETMIIPVLEEVLVVEKRLVLKEEVQVTRKRREEHQPQQVTLREEEVNVERFQNNAAQENAAHKKQED